MQLLSVFLRWKTAPRYGRDGVLELTLTPEVCHTWRRTDTDDAVG